ncbi:MAG: hypothetical protein J7M19_09330, partial [Planctomycetes bacterium]|nr:hypothetical protein [Planctomycetota bacterium]
MIAWKKGYVMDNFHRHVTRVAEGVFFAILIFVSLSGVCNATTYYMPDDYSTIADAFDPSTGIS